MLDEVERTGMTAISARRSALLHPSTPGLQELLYNFVHVMPAILVHRAVVGHNVIIREDRTMDCRTCGERWRFH